MVSVNGERLLSRINELGKIGKDAEGRRTRLAASDADKQGRDLVSEWMKEAGLEVVTDRIGNIFGIWETPENKDQAPLMIGSHIDTVINAGLAAAKVIVFLRQLVEKSGGVATVGCIEFKPNAINVIPSKAVFTVDLRNPDKEKLDNDEKILSEYLKNLAKEDDVRISAERMTEFDPVPFDKEIVEKVEKAAKAHGLSVKRITSGAGQDAQMLARLCPTAMIFVPSVKGISHNPEEYTKDEDVLAGADVFLDVIMDMVQVK